MAELIHHHASIIQTIIVPLCTTIQGSSEEVPLLLALVEKLAGIKSLLMELSRVLQPKSTKEVSEIEQDLDICLSACRMLSKRTQFQLARMEVKQRDSDLDSQFSIAEKRVQNAKAGLQEINQCLSSLQEGLVVLVEASSCDKRSKRIPLLRQASSKETFQKIRRQTEDVLSIDDRNESGCLNSFRVSLATLPEFMSRLFHRLPLGNPGSSPGCLEAKKRAAEARNKSHVIDQQIMTDAKQPDTICMLPLLWVGHGMTQEMILEHFIVRTATYDPGASPVSAAVIRQQIMRHVQQLVNQALGSDVHPIGEDLKPMVKAILASCGNDTEPSEELVHSLKSLWSHPDFRYSYVTAWEPGNLDYGDFIVAAAERASNPFYTPGMHDTYRFAMDRYCVLHQGIFVADGISINFINSRRWRRKHLDIYSNAPCMLYCVDLMDYSVLESEHGPVTRMTGCLVHFDSVVRSKYFKSTSIMLVFSNLSRFLSSLQKKPLSVCFPDYVGHGDPAKAFGYLKSKFLELNTDDREIFVHAGELADPGMYDFIVSSVKASLLSRALQRGATLGPNHSGRSRSGSGLIRSGIRNSLLPSA